MELYETVLYKVVQNIDEVRRGFIKLLMGDMAGFGGYKLVENSHYF